MATSKHFNPDPYTPRAPPAALDERYTAVLGQQSLDSHLRLLSPIGEFLSRYDGQFETQESFAREIHDYLRYYLRLKRLNDGVLIAPWIQRYFIEQGRGEVLNRQRECGAEQTSQATQTSSITEIVEKNSSDKGVQCEVVDLVEPVVTSTISADDQGSGAPAHNDSSATTDHPNPPSSPNKYCRGQKRKAEEDLSITSTAQSDGMHVMKAIDLYKEITRAKNRDANAKANCRLSVQRTPGYRGLSRQEQDARFAEDWNRVRKQRQIDGVSYEAFVEKMEAEVIVLKRMDA